MTSRYSEEMREKLKAMTKDMIKPEPQYSSINSLLDTPRNVIFHKLALTGIFFITAILSYLSRHCYHKRDQRNGLVYLTNSHGVQLRSDVKYWTDKREDNGKQDAEKLAPVLDCSHLKLFENFDDLLTKLRNLPEEWTVIQITKQYSPLDVLEAVKNQSDTAVFLTRFTCGKLAERVLPYYVNIKSRNHTDENFMQLFRDLFKIRSDYFTSGGISRKIKEDYANTDASLAKLLFELENHWLKEWRCLLGGRLEDKKLESKTYQHVKKALDDFIKENKKMKSYSEGSLDIVYQLTLAVHLMKNFEILKVLNYALYNNVNEDEDMIDMIPLMEVLKQINSGNSCALRKAKKLPVILIIDKAFEIIPWETLSLLSGQPVTRILSLHLLFGLFKYHETDIVEGYRILKIDSGFCLINPNKDLNDCEREMTKFLKMNMPWIESEVGKVPDPKYLISKFYDSNVFLYCGHGSGRQYLKSSDLKKAFVKGLILLFGCSSNLPKTAGGRTPYHNDTYTYMTNGSPCQIGCIYDITSSDADAACKEMLQNFLPMSKENDPCKMMMPKEPDVLRGLIAGKSACKKYWSQCSFVARGIPCKTEAGYICNKRK